jgi:hypothetical protein
VKPSGSPRREGVAESLRELEVARGVTSTDRFPEQEASTGSHRPSNCPYCVPQGMVRDTTDPAHRTLAAYSMHPSGGGYRQPVTYETATGLGLPPSVFDE